MKHFADFFVLISERRAKCHTFVTSPRLEVLQLWAATISSSKTPDTGHPSVRC